MHHLKAASNLRRKVVIAVDPDIDAHDLVIDAHDLVEVDCATSLGSSSTGTKLSHRSFFTRALVEHAIHAPMIRGWFCALDSKSRMK
jgi:hypothetical protein